MDITITYDRELCLFVLILHLELLERPRAKNELGGQDKVSEVM